MQELEKILEEINMLIEKHKNEAYILAAKEPLTQCYTETDIEQTKVHELAVARNIIRKHMNDGWIPMEDRLPEDDVGVLVTYADIDDEQYTDIAITTYGYAYLGSNKLDFKEWRSPFKYFRSNYKVIAWRPLPEPLPARKERGRMRQYIVTEYEQEDYEDFKRNLTNEQVVELLKRISRGYLPDYNFAGTEEDFDNYCLHKAIDKAIEALEERNDNHDGE